jgi:hypothetical protein
MTTDGGEHSPDAGTADICTAVGTTVCEHSADPWGVLGGALAYLVECGASPRLHSDTVSAARDAAEALMRLLGVEPAAATGPDPASPDVPAWPHLHPRAAESGAP